MLPSTSARGPVPAMPTVNSRPERNVSTSTGWRYLASSSAERRPSDCRSRIFEAAVMPLPVPSATGLANSGGTQVHAVHVLDPLDQGEIGRGQPGGADNRLRQALVQGQRHDQGVGKGVGDLVQVEDGGHLGLAGQAVQPLGDVEDQVPAVAGGQALDQLPPVADGVGLVAEGFQGGLEGRDGGRLVEFRRFLFAIAGGQVIGPQVVGQTDMHKEGKDEGSGRGEGRGEHQDGWRKADR